MLRLWWWNYWNSIQLSQSNIQMWMLYLMNLFKKKYDSMSDTQNYTLLNRNKIFWVKFCVIKCIKLQLTTRYFKKCHQNYCNACSHESSWKKKNSLQNYKNVNNSRDFKAIAKQILISAYQIKKTKIQTYVTMTKWEKSSDKN